MNKVSGQLRSPEDWINFLIDDGSFLPLTPPSTSGTPGFGDEIITGLAEVNSRPVALWSCRPEVNQGYVTSSGAIKIRRLMDRAHDLGIPIVSILASPGVSIEEGVRSGEEYSRVMMRTVELSGLIPQLACVMGVNIGAPAYSAALQDLVLFNRLRSHLCVSGPGVVKQVLGENTTFSALGGSQLHSQETGLAGFVDENIEAQLRRCQWLLNFLPPNYLEDAPVLPDLPPVTPLPEIPTEIHAAFDMTSLLRALLDRSELVEYAPLFGPSGICAFGRVGGFAVGVIASQSLHMSGALDVDSSRKIARFIRVCDAYNIPLITFVDAPGFMPGSDQEKRGILQAGAELIYAMKTRSPKVSVVVRKCYGAAAIVLSQTRNWNGDLVLSLPSARNAVMGFEAAREVLYKNDPRPVDALKAHYYEHFERPEVTLGLGLVDEVVQPQLLRPRLIQHLRLLQRKKPNPTSPVRAIHP